MWYPAQTVKLSGQIERIRKPTKAAFTRYVANHTPVIIQGALEDQRAWSTWTSEYLNDHVGDAECDVFVSRPGEFAGGVRPHDEEHCKFVKMRLRDCLERMSAPDQAAPIFWPNERYAPYKVPPQLFDAVLQDLSIPEFVAYRSVYETNVWVSQRGNITLPHTDFAENLLTQIRGRKNILLWDTSQWAPLYLNPLGRAHSRQSQIDIAKPDVAKFPLFSRARAVAGNLEAGDALFIPFGYIHCVHSETFSISVNYWWGTSPFEKFRSTLFSPLFSYCASTPGTSAKLLAQGLLRRMLGRTRVVQNKAPTIIETAVRLGDRIQPRSASQP